MRILPMNVWQRVLTCVFIFVMLLLVPNLGQSLNLGHHNYAYVKFIDIKTL